ncbi:hypothetical protein HYV49_01025 [Candidatus Pacearchaeota archaeon]|nr:hypothetical protein [Candidatus Pacearchaeota archaeon]
MLNRLSDEDIYLLFEKDQWEESRIIGDWAEYGTEQLAAKVAQYFHKSKGKDVIPVDSMQDAIELQNHGMNGVVVPKTIKKLIELQEGSAESKKQKRAYEYSIVSELSETEQHNFLWAVNLLKSIKLELPIQVVNFVGENVFGIHKPGEVYLSKKILSDRKELVATLVHEIAHEKGNDGEPNHIKEMENIFSQLIVKLTKEEQK